MINLLLHRFSRLALNQPDHPAVVDRGRSISYRELDDQSGRVASFLHDREIGPERRVAVLLEKSIEAVVVILGVLKAGAAYVPLDPLAPERRVAEQVGDSRADAVFLTGSSPLLADPVLTGSPATIVVVGSEAGAPAGPRGAGWDDILASPPRPLCRRTAGQDPAYLLYTSGSTGEPKGVVISHGAARAFVDWSAGLFQLSSRDRVSSHAPFHFDLSIFDLFASLSAGASVVLIPPELSAFPASLAEFIRDQGITIWYSVPTILSRLARQEEILAGGDQALRLVLFAGEVFQTRNFLSLSRLLPKTHFFNLYGPTETNVCTVHAVLGISPDEPIPIGKPCPYSQVWVLKANGLLAVTGETGELYVAGDSLMSGYWQRSAATRRDLLSPPPPAIPSDSPVFRTGDLVRIDPEGNLIFAGRVDSMIKRRGYRIELGEIEACLNQDPRIQEACVEVIPREGEQPFVEAFVVFQKPGSGDERTVDGILRKSLPEYMLPDRVKLLARLPRTSRGKVDHQRLKEMGSAS